MEWVVLILMCMDMIYDYFLVLSGIRHGKLLHQLQLPLLVRLISSGYFTLENYANKDNYGIIKLWMTIKF